MPALFWQAILSSKRKLLAGGIVLHSILHYTPIVSSINGKLFQELPAFTWLEQHAAIKAMAQTSNKYIEYEGGIQSVQYICNIYYEIFLSNALSFVEL